MSDSTTHGGNVPTLFCPECKRPLLNIVSGATCGHGCKVGLFPRVPAAISKAASAELSGDSGQLVKAYHAAIEMDVERYVSREVYIAAGKLWRRVTKTAKKDMHAEDRMAIVDGRVIHITPWKAINDLLAETTPFASVPKVPTGVVIEPGEIKHGVENMGQYPVTITPPATALPAEVAEEIEAEIESESSGSEFQELEPADFANVPEAERRAWFGVIRRGTRCPWEASGVRSTVTAWKCRRDPATGQVEFGCGDPDEPTWVTIPQFAQTYPEGYSEDDA